MDELASEPVKPAPHLGAPIEPVFNDNGEIIEWSAKFVVPAESLVIINPDAD
jgi:hypothetical protein